MLISIGLWLLYGVIWSVHQNGWFVRHIYSALIWTVFRVWRGRQLSLCYWSSEGGLQQNTLKIVIECLWCMLWLWQLKLKLIISWLSAEADYLMTKEIWYTYIWKINYIDKDKLMRQTRVSIVLVVSQRNLLLILKLFQNVHPHLNHLWKVCAFTVIQSLTFPPKPPLTNM